VGLLDVADAMRIPSSCLPEKRTHSSYHCLMPRAIPLALARQVGQRH
jgi:hypothetical protein